MLLRFVDHLLYCNDRWTLAIFDEAANILTISRQATAEQRQSIISSVSAWIPLIGDA